MRSTRAVEHHFTGWHQVSATLTLLTWLAARTRTLRLGTAVMVLPWHNPVLLAEQVATLDLMSDGRLDFGVGKGYRCSEFKGFAVALEEADARFEEALDVILRAWTSERRFSHRGRYWQFDDIVVEPPTRQQPHPPIWMAAGSAPSIRKVAARDFNLMLDQFASIEVIGERLAHYRVEVEAHGRVDTVARRLARRLRQRRLSPPALVSLEMHGRRFLQSPARLAERLHLVPNARVLEIGPGSGFFSTAVARAVPVGHLALFDFQPEMLARALHRLERAGLTNFSCTPGDAGRHLPFPDGDFDAVFLVTVPGEVPDRPAWLREIFRVLKPGGLVSFTEVRPDPDFVSREALGRLLTMAGFELVESWGFWWSWRHRVPDLTIHERARPRAPAHQRRRRSDAADDYAGRRHRRHADSGALASGKWYASQDYQRVFAQLDLTELPWRGAFVTPIVEHWNVSDDATTQLGLRWTQVLSRRLALRNSGVWRHPRRATFGRSVVVDPGGGRRRLCGLPRLQGWKLISASGALPEHRPCATIQASKFIRNSGTGPPLRAPMIGALVCPLDGRSSKDAARA